MNIIRTLAVDAAAAAAAAAVSVLVSQIFAAQPYTASTNLVCDQASLRLAYLMLIVPQRRLVVLTQFAVTCIDRHSVVC